MAQLVDRELAADGVAADGYAMLSLIGVRGAVRLTALAEELGMPLTTASDTVRRLEARSLVRRLENPEDGRSWLFELSATGDREWRRGWGALQRIDGRLEQELGDATDIRRSLDELGRAFAVALTEL
jgi:DNA-binding MarR family transcriptional regulator